MHLITKATFLKALEVYKECSIEGWGVNDEKPITSINCYDALSLIEDLSDKDVFLTPETVCPNEVGGIDFVIKNSDLNEFSFLYLEEEQDYWFYFYDKDVDYYTINYPAYIDGTINPKVLKLLLNSIIVN